MFRRRSPFMCLALIILLAGCTLSSRPAALAPARSAAPRPVTARTARATTPPASPAPTPASAGDASLFATLAAMAPPTPTPTVPHPTATPLRSDAPEVTNLVAFAHLYGYVRYFHPSDQAVAADWERVAISGVQTIRAATNPGDLAQRLQDFFEPIAPTVRVFPVGHRPAVPAELTPPAQASGLQIVMWRHTGVAGDTSQDTYHSDRLRQAAPRGAIPPGFHDPRSPFYAELGGGVAALVPLALFADSQGTLPHHAAPNGTATPQPVTAAPRDTYLAGVIIAWNVFQHFYPYFDVVATDWPRTLRESLAAVATAENADTYEQQVTRLVAALHDGHGSVIRSGDTDPPVYVPPVLLTYVEGQVVVVRASGEAAVQLRPGDVVVAVDGRPTRDVLADKEALISGATPQWIRYRGVQSLLAGHLGSRVSVKVQGMAGAARTATLQRMVAEWDLPVEPRPEQVTEIEPGILYVDLTRVADPDFMAALPRLEQAKGIVFDLRGYPKVSPETIGYLIRQPVTSSQWLVPQVTQPDRQGMTFELHNWSVEPKTPHLTARVAFLTDGRAISYAETYLGIVEHYHIAPIVGEPTAGTNGDINRFTIPGGLTITWTGMKVLKQDGSRHHGVGIQPTVPVSPTRAGIAAGRDEQLERAIALVKPTP